jgi:peptidoglycan/LPS O-acetylase OafA/YrhL
MYLWHPTFIPLVEIYVGPQQIADELKALLALIVFLGGTTTMAALTYVLVERPFLILKARYLSPAPRAEPTPVTSKGSPAPPNSPVLGAS